jgi:hypothetical protein
VSKVAIFGSGLSAAYVYAACLDNGVEADFFTDNRKPEFFGPVKLEWVPVKLQSVLLRYPVWLFSLGTKKNYLKNMERSSGSTTFPENGRTETLAYNPTEVLEQLQPQGKVTLGKFSDIEIRQLSHSYAYSFVTFPLQSSKGEGKLVPYWLWLLKNQNMSLPNMVIYNGTFVFPWTRFSYYWDTQMWEYSHTEKEEPVCPAIGAELRRIADIAPGVPEYTSPFHHVALVGRWARWSKSVLAQDAYAQADKILKEIK